MNPRTTLLASLLSAPVLMLLGCATPPQGDASGRYSVNTTTNAEARSVQILPTSLIEASDKVAQELAADVQRIADETGKGFRVTIIFGNIENKTQGTVSTYEFEMVRDRIKTRLNQSKMFRENVRFLSQRAKVEDVNRRELPGVGDQPPAVMSQANPQYTLQLNGSMYGIYRGSTNLYYLKFELDRASDGETVFSSDYEVKRG
jgi:hypothetical protein